MTNVKYYSIREERKKLESTKCLGGNENTAYFFPFCEGFIVYTWEWKVKACAGVPDRMGWGGAVKMTTLKPWML